MVRPREFDRSEALQKAITVFWRKGFAAASTDELLKEMGIGRQSLYNAFGDKRQLYLEAVRSYMEGTFGGHLERLNKPKSPLQGIRRLLLGLAAPNDDTRALGCLGVGAAEEFGTQDPELLALLQVGSRFLEAQLVKRIREGQEAGEIASSMDAEKAAAFVQMMMNALQLAARTGADVQRMHGMADFVVDRLKAD